MLLSCFPPCREEDIDEIQSEIAMLKQCHSPAITAYYGSALVPGTSQLMIAMELMAASAADLVRPPCCRLPSVSCTASMLHVLHSQLCS